MMIPFEKWRYKPSSAKSVFFRGSSLSDILSLVRASCPQPFGPTPSALPKIAPGDFVAT